MLEQAKEKLEITQARAGRFFEADEDLPLSEHIMLAIIALFFISFIVWANWATLDEITRGQGKVIPSSEIQIIQHQEGGIVEAFLVREGDEVEAGQILIRLSDIGASADYGANQKRFWGLQAKIARLQVEAAGKPVLAFSEDVMKMVPESVTEEMNSFKANKVNLRSQLVILEQQLSQKKQEITELKTRRADLETVVRLVREEKKMIEPLVKRGSAPRFELLQLERDLKERQTEINSLRSSLPRTEAAVEEAQARIDELKSSSKAQAQNELSATTIEMSTIKETLAALEDRKTRTDIRSPVHGTIKDIKVHTVGGVVQAGEDLIEIVPKDDQLLIEAQIRPSDIAFLHPGQNAVVKITAYDYSIYGGLKGILVDISADSIVNDQGESFYRVRIRTPEAHLTRKGEVLEIIPGMVASVDVLTGKKTVMEYLLKPFIKTLDEALHER